jgi:hypothetical protein
VSTDGSPGRSGWLLERLLRLLSGGGDESLAAKSNGQRLFPPNALADYCLATCPVTSRWRPPDPAL